MADSNKNSNKDNYNKDVRPIPFDIDSTEQRRRFSLERMLMNIEIDRVVEKYNHMNMFRGPVVTVRDIELKLMMEEEINSIILKYGASISPTNEDLSHNNDQEMPSESRDEDRQRKCRRRLPF